MFLGLSTAAFVHDAYWGGCRFLKHGMVWEIVTGTYSGFGVCHSLHEDSFFLFNDNATAHFHFLRVSNKKAVALFNNRPSNIIITLDTLCNKFKMDGRRTVNPNNKSS